jgi:hypothetical protein
MWLLCIGLIFCVLDDDLPLLPAAAPPPHAGQQQEVANPAALVQIPCRWTSAPAVATAAAVVVVGKVPDFWVTLTKFAVDCKFSVDCGDAEKDHHQQQVQLVSRILYFPSSSSSSQFSCLMQILSRNYLHVQRDDSTLQCSIKLQELSFD